MKFEDLNPLDLLVGPDLNTGELIYLEWDLLNAIGITGRAGSGKTGHAAYYLSQYALMGVRLIICDKHGKKRQGLTKVTEHLRNADLLPPVITYAKTTAYISQLMQIGNERLELESDDESTFEPVMLIIDEFTDYMISSPDAKEAVLNLAKAVNEFRKVNIRFMFLSHTWNFTKEGAKLRDLINAGFINKTSENEAKKFSMDRNIQKGAMGLNAGKMYFDNHLIFVPRLTETDKMFIEDTLAKRRNRPIVNSPQHTQKEVIQMKDNKIDGRWSKTRVLAHLLNVDFKTLKEKGKYN